MGAALEFVRTGVNGWLVPASDETAILQAMREAAQVTDDGLARLSRGARESVKEHTLEAGSQRFVRFAQETIGV
jgi:glycosyltransferase involved in cell wall biosynthesis